MKAQNWVIVIVVLSGLLFAVFRPSIDLLPDISNSVQATDTASSKDSRLNGIDVAYYQGDISWSSVSADGIAFAYVKATEGVTYTDPQYANNIKKLKNTDIQFGSYHFFRPKDDAQQQAKFFLSKVDVKGQLPPVLDIEVTQDESPDNIKSSAMAWLKAVESQSGCKPIIYTDKSFWETNLGNEFKDYSLWLADYADKPSLPAGVNKYIYWQHSQSGKVDGISGNVDLDTYSGSKEELNSLLCKS